jgi:hypothetical protein
MNTFAKTYHTDDFIISVRIKRDEMCYWGCRLTIKDKNNISFRGPSRIVYTGFLNDRYMFDNCKREMKKVKVPKKTVDGVIDDIKGNLLFEKVVVYQPIKTKLPWN